ncbi:MAG: 1-acyl-sn-glycerol-3-phosphate acyltransferase [Pseudomonadales bacterium]
MGEKPQHPKYILIAAPHTSNWDFVLFLMLAFIVRLDVHWMGKEALFPTPIKRLVIWLGGIPIDRSKANNVVDQMGNYFANV